MSANLLMAFIQGREIDLNDHQKILYKKNFIHNDMYIVNFLVKTFHWLIG